MLVHASTVVNAGLLTATLLQERGFPFPRTPRLRISGSVVSCKMHDLTGNGFRYSNMSFQVMEKTGSDDLQDLPLSSSYETAMDALSSLITQRKRGERSSVVPKLDKLERMSMYLKILGLEEHVAGLKIIHVAGTKGKGSTCTFCEAILRESGFKTGLFTSPHLIDVRERFRINGLNISEEKFLLYFWDCWNLLKENITDDLPMPPLFQFLTVLAFKIFSSEQVDVAIIEVGIGGKDDSTNVIKEPVVCGIASLGMDHLEFLGTTLGQIASHKAGIFKPQIPAFTVPQLSEAMEVLHDRAQELTVPLTVAEPLSCEELKGLKLSLSGDHQLTNAGLAVSLCKSWLKRTGNFKKIFHDDSLEADLPESFRRGLSTAHLLGRAQIVQDSVSKCNSSEIDRPNSGNLTFYLDGAHSPESMEACARWFSSAVKENKEASSLSQRNGYVIREKEKVNESKEISKQILLFNCMDVRDPQILLPRLVSTCSSSGTHFSKALFVPSMSAYTKVTSAASVIPSDIRKDLSWQFSLQRLWEKIMHGEDPVLEKSLNMKVAETLPPSEFLYEDASRCSAVMPSLPLAIKWLRDCVKENPSLRVQVLVTGSLHLVGDVLKLLRR